MLPYYVPINRLDSDSMWRRWTITVRLLLLLSIYVTEQHSPAPFWTSHEMGAMMVLDVASVAFVTTMSMAMMMIMTIVPLQTLHTIDTDAAADAVAAVAAGCRPKKPPPPPQEISVASFEWEEPPIHYCCGCYRYDQKDDYNNDFDVELDSNSRMG
jgi:hypothetical protein